MVRVGVVGCGTIGSELARALERDHAQRVRIVALCDQSRACAVTLQQHLRTHPPIVSLPTLIRRSQLVIEAASASVSARVARSALAAHRDVLIMSTGGLLADRSSWQRIARRSRGRLYVPSGALCGVDGIKAMAAGTIRRIRLTTSKPPKALASAPYVRAKHLRLDRLRRRTLIFEGTPRQVTTAFPHNTNVAATMLLACLSSGRTPKSVRVRVVADPALRTNRHELDLEGDAGRIRVRIDSRPSATNPKTSELAVRSAMATLRQLFEPVRIGT